MKDHGNDYHCHIFSINDLSFKFNNMFGLHSQIKIFKYYVLTSSLLTNLQWKIKNLAF